MHNNKVFEKGARISRNEIRMLIAAYILNSFGVACESIRELSRQFCCHSTAIRTFHQYENTHATAKYLSTTI